MSVKVCCFNELKVFGTKEDIDEFIKANIGTPVLFHKSGYSEESYEKYIGPVFTLNALVPIPDDVLHQSDEDEICEWMEENWGQCVDCLDYVTREHYTEGQVKEMYDPYNECLVIGYTTGRGTLLEWLFKIYHLFPRLGFQFTFASPNERQAGIISISSGEFFEEYAVSDEDVLNYLNSMD